MSGDAHKAGAEALTALLNQAFSALGEKEYASAACLSPYAVPALQEVPS